METIRRINPGTRMSAAVVHGETIYLSGQVADDPSKDAGDQTRQILTKIETLLSQAGSDKKHILFANVWLADIATYDEMNAAWDAWVAKDALPARATVESKLAEPQYRVEIAVIAATAS
jgi:enamine deaminase RidA (YjgF/YER057c/UK114 family)